MRAIIIHDAAMINYYAILSLFSAVVCSWLAIYVFLLDRKNRLNVLFAAMLITLSVWLSSEAAYRQAADIASAFLWIKVRAFIWPLTIALMLHFVLIYTKQKSILEKKLTYVLIYVPAVVYSVLEATTELITGPPIMEPWGFTYSIPDNLINLSSIIWTAALAIGALLILFRYHRKAPDRDARIQAGYVVLGLSIPILVGIITEIIIPQVFNARVLEVFGLSCLVFCFFVVYTMRKHNLFPMTPEIVTKSILSSISDGLVLVNPEGSITYSNDAMQSILGYSADQLKNANVDMIFEKGSGATFSGLVPKLKSGSINDMEVRLQKKGGAPVQVSLSGSCILGESGALEGFVLVGRDISKRKIQEQELREKSEELEKINKIAIGRELKMVELKKRVEELESELKKKQ